MLARREIVTRGSLQLRRTSCSCTIWCAECFPNSRFLPLAYRVIYLMRAVGSARPGIRELEIIMLQLVG